MTTKALVLASYEAKTEDLALRLMTLMKLCHAIISK